MSEVEQSQKTGSADVVSNAFGEHSLFAINHNVFKNTDASTVFRSYFGESIFEEDTFYIIAGTDSGLLYQYVKVVGVPKGSRYLFVELPQVLKLFGDTESQTEDLPHAELVIANDENWLEEAINMGVKNHALRDRLVLLHSLGVVHGHYTDYPPFRRKLEKEFETLNWDHKATLGNRPFFICQLENLTENQTPAIHLKDTFIGKTAVVLAGGPSLDELLPWIRKHRDNLLVIAVSRISGSLIDAGINPDISVSIDPYPINLNVSRDMFKFKDNTLLVNEFHLTSSLLSSWSGRKMFTGPRYPWPTPLQPENLTPTKGSTVTNTAFSLAIEMGVKQIVLGGADFCFSQDGYTHASGTQEHAIGPTPQLGDQQVETNSGMTADTINAFIMSAGPVDKLAQDALSKGCRTINPAPGAMRLPNVEHLSIDDIQIEAMEKPASETLADCTPTTNSQTRTKLYKEILSETDRVLKELVAIKELSGKALVYNRKLFATGEPGTGFHNKDKVERIEKQLNEKYASTSRFIRAFGVNHFTPILGLDDDRNVEDLEESCRLYHQAFIDTSIELIEILRSTRARILSRIEEEKPKPNMQRLLDQWHLDQQPGRAILWGQQHTNYVDQLPKTQQQELHTFQNTFNNTVDKMGQDYAANLKKSSDIDTVIKKSMEYFLDRDKSGLLRLLTGLQKQNEQQQAGNFIALVEGYISELDNELLLAITEYKKVLEGPAYLPALMRLFELHTKNQDKDSALEVLHILSGMNSTFIPMYADMLQSIGDIDRAVELYTDYLLTNPNDLNTMMKLGKLFQLCESKEGVEWTMNYILGKDPKNQLAQQTLEEMGLGST